MGNTISPKDTLLNTRCLARQVFFTPRPLSPTPSDLLSDLSLDGAGDARIADAEQAAGGRAGGEPVTASQPLYQRLEVDLQVDRGVLLRDLSQGLHGFVSDNRLLHCGEALQGRLPRRVGKSRYQTFTQIF